MMLTEGLVDEAIAFLSGRIRRTPVVLAGAFGDSRRPRLAQARVPAAHRLVQTSGGALQTLEALRDGAPSWLCDVLCGQSRQSRRVRSEADGTARLVCVPRTVDDAKYRGIVELGADVRRSPFPGYDSTEDWAVGEAAREGLPFISPYEEGIVAAGGGSLAVEILEDLPDARTFLIPTGGGGLAAGVAFEALRHHAMPASSAASMRGPQDCCGRSRPATPSADCLQSRHPPALSRAESPGFVRGAARARRARTYRRRARERIGDRTSGSVGDGRTPVPGRTRVSRCGGGGIEERLDCDHHSGRDHPDRTECVDQSNFETFAGRLVRPGRRTRYRPGLPRRSAVCSVTTCTTATSIALLRRQRRPSSKPSLEIFKLTASPSCTPPGACQDPHSCRCTRPGSPAARLTGAGAGSSAMPSPSASTPSMPAA